MTEERADQRTSPIASLVSKECGTVEMIYREEDRVTRFARFHDGLVSECLTLDVARLGCARPYSPDNNLLTHRVVLFPSEALDYSDEATLLGEIRGFIHRYADLSDGFEEIATFYVLLSWIYDAFNEVPYLRLKGDFGSGKTRCLLAIGSLCYKPMFVSGASTVSPMFRIIDAFRGTLILDESDFRFSDEKAEIIKILNNGNAVGFPVLRSEVTPTKEFNPRAFAVFGPKIIASRSLFDDKALESRCITEVMSGLPPRQDIPLSLPTAFHVEALALRNKLLMYRFHNLQRSHDLTIARSARIEARVAQVFAPLLSLVADPSARQRILALAEGHTGTMRAERDASVEAQLLDIILSMRRDGSSLSMKDIATQFADRYGSDYERPITPRWIGGQIRRRLSITPIKSHGTFIIPESSEARLASLFERYGLVDIAGDVGTSGTFAGSPSES